MYLWKVDKQGKNELRSQELLICFVIVDGCESQKVVSYLFHSSHR